MAIDLSTEYPSQVDTSDPTGYPYGKARNRTSPGDGTGTPWIDKVANDIFGLQQALLSEADITPSGTPDKVGASQYLTAILQLAARESAKVSEVRDMLRCLGGAWEVRAVAAVGNALACMDLDDGGILAPRTVAIAAGDTVFLVSEDGGFTWIDLVFGIPVYRDVAIGKMEAGGWCALAVGDSGLYYWVYRLPEDDTPQVASIGQLLDESNLTSVVFDHVTRPPEYEDEKSYRFWATSPAGIYRFDLLSTGIDITKVSSNAADSICVLPSGRVVAVQSVAGVPRLTYSDDGGETAFVVGADLTSYVTSSARVCYDEPAERLVVAFGNTKLAVSSDGGATISASQTYADALIVAGSWRGRAIIFSTNGTGDGQIYKAFVRKAAAWSFDIDPDWYGVGLPGSALFPTVGAHYGSRRFITANPLSPSDSVIISELVAPLV